MKAEALKEEAGLSVDDEKQSQGHLRVVDTPEGESVVADSSEASDGSAASLEVDADGGEKLVVRDGRGVLLFEFSPDSSRCVVYSPVEDLVLRAARGSIELDAAEGLKLRSGTTLEVETNALRTTATSADVELDTANLSVDVLTGSFRRVRHTVDILETTAGRIVERAKETYREVEGLAQTRADRIRHVAERTFHILGTHTLFKAREDLKLKGEKIHLG